MLIIKAASMRWLRRVGIFVLVKVLRLHGSCNQPNRKDYIHFTGIHGSNSVCKMWSKYKCWQHCFYEIARVSKISLKMVETIRMRTEFKVTASMLAAHSFATTNTQTREESIEACAEFDDMYPDHECDRSTIRKPGSIVMIISSRKKGRGSTDRQDDVKHAFCTVSIPRLGRCLYILKSWLYSTRVTVMGWENMCTRQVSTLRVHDRPYI